MEIFTYLTNKNKIRDLVKSASQHHVKIKYMVSKKGDVDPSSYNYWEVYIEKIWAMKRVIKEKNDNEIVCFIDAYDVLINENTQLHLYEKFIKHDKPIAFGAEMCCYPEKYKNRHDEHNQRKSSPPQTNHRYLNGGGYIGYVGAVKKMLEWKSETEIMEICQDGGDQSYFIEYMLNHPEEVELDTRAEMFLNMHRVDWKKMDINTEGKIENKELGNVPCVVHFNGGSWQTDKKENILSIITKCKEKKESRLWKEHKQIRTESCSPICQTILPPPRLRPRPRTHPPKNQSPRWKWDDIGLDCHVFYINLKRREDRKREMEAQMEKYGIPIERFDAVDRPEPTKGIVGCTQSHLAVLKLAKERNYQTVLIFEDDFEITMQQEELYAALHNLVTNNIRYDVCMLGYKLEEGKDTEYEFLKRAYKTISASAYLVRREFYQKIIDLYEWAIPLLESTGEHWNYANDQVWNQLKPNALWYCIHPRVGKQRDGYSDNSETYTIYDC